MGLCTATDADCLGDLEMAMQRETVATVLGHRRRMFSIGERDLCTKKCANGGTGYGMGAKGEVCKEREGREEGEKEIRVTQAAHLMVVTIPSYSECGELH